MAMPGRTKKARGRLPLLSVIRAGGIVGAVNHAIKQRSWSELHEPMRTETAPARDPRRRNRRSGESRDQTKSWSGLREPMRTETAPARDPRRRIVGAVNHGNLRWDRLSSSWPGSSGPPIPACAAADGRTRQARTRAGVGMSNALRVGITRSNRSGSNTLAKRSRQQRPRSCKPRRCERCPGRGLGRTPVSECRSFRDVPMHIVTYKRTVLRDARLRGQRPSTCCRRRVTRHPHHRRRATGRCAMIRSETNLRSPCHATDPAAKPPSRSCFPAPPRVTPDGTSEPDRQEDAGGQASFRLVAAALPRSIATS